MADEKTDPPVAGRSRHARFARWALGRVGFRLVGTFPQRGIVVGAPHTSNWDFVLAVLVFWAHDVHPRVLVKTEMFWWPLGPFLRWIGAVETDRRGGTGLVERLATEAAAADRFVLALAPDGTRRAVDHWKSGFYRLAMSTGLPVTLAFADGPSKTVGTGPTLEMTGDVTVDMDRIRAYYTDKRGIRPERASAVRLREEDAG
ncbi:1-acyl-sn-glycerol-3-phosphate acyltransferase [Actinotalea sp. M2MS4P-6]|uniref:1-acyl-sn-glycerol-3-phosphate acyltransferase n=1 Tax=Actinotalea sp. M2MS4P-6 TaxID=2983762 RepID=UPI0021E3C356|nr:1-acyl-sn-glycerol-3-phosphate acyltransferase [Actinotalea sp. M2MS4P-6]MCV2394885.1 1-acyl-sn-glycerol-3-phosphate acyltransferase [Actinotalea sp. M2MS4P-6]